MRFDRLTFPTFLAPEGVAIAIVQSLDRQWGKGGSATPGAQLAEAADYCNVPQGLLLDHRILFPDPVPIGRQAILIWLERMIHAPRNPQVINTILKATARDEIIVTVGDGRKSARTEWLPLIADLPKLAGQLASAQVAHPAFVRLLLRGELGSASHLLPADGWPDLPYERAAKLLRDVAVLWSLHDLQVMAARLYQALYQPTGFFAQSEPARTHVSTICASVKEIRRALSAIRAALGRNNRPLNAHEYGEWTWLLGFIEKHGLEALARARAKEAAIVVDEADSNAAGSPATMRKVQDLLTHLERNLGRPIGEAFQTVSAAETRRPADVARWCHVRQKNRRLQEHGKALAKVPDKKELAGASVAQLQFGMEPTIALAYAIVLFVLRMGKIEQVISDWQLRPGSDLLVDSATPLTNAQKRTIDALVTVYRAAILRDVGHLQDAADTPKPAMEAVGSVHSAKAPLLPPTGKPLTVKDATHGRGVSLEDKLPGGDPFSYAPGNASTKSRFKRPGRPAIEAARALIAQQPINPHFDMSLGWRLRAQATIAFGRI